MSGAHEFLKALSVVLCVAAVTTVLFQKLRQPVVLGYILAGLIVGPFIPLPFVADSGVVMTLSELGVILLMFGLGLEFRLRTIFEVGPTAALTALVETSLMLWLGFTVGRLFGWTQLESLFCGSIVAISSTTIIAKAFGEQGISGRLKELVLGILIIEDMIAILLMTTLTAVSSGAGLSAADMAVTAGKLVAFLVGLIVLGLLVFPRFMRMVVSLGRAETTLVASIGICFAVALLASELGYSSALGAFLAGSLIAETGEGKRIEHLVQPVRDIFAAIFFVSVGMLIDPKVVIEYWQPTLVLFVVVIIGKTIGVSFGAFLTGAGTRNAVAAGMSMSQIGEFSFIIASLGLTLNATGKFLYPIAITVSALTTLTTPFMIRASSKAAAYVDRKLPSSLQTFTSLYSSWVEQLKTSKPQKPGGVRRRIQLLVVDAAMLVGLIVLTSIYGDDLVDWFEDFVHISREAASVAVLGTAGLLAVPLVIGLVTVARRLGRTLAERVMPQGEDGRVDLVATPRRALVVAFELTTVLLVGAPLLAITQPFLPGFHGAAVLSVFGVVLAVLFWRSANDLQGHVRAGAEVLVAALAQQAQAGPSLPAETGPVMQQIDVGLGRPLSIQLVDNSPGAGHSLAQLNLRGATGASVLAIIRDGVGTVPTASELLRVGDIVALSGTREAIEAARVLMLDGVLVVVTPPVLTDEARTTEH